MVKFSIVTVCLNSMSTIRNTIMSVLNQTLKPYEYIIVDGVSSDETLNIVNSYKKAFADKGIYYRITSETDNGVYDAMNKALDFANGDFLIFMGSDDYFINENVLYKVNEAINDNANRDNIYYGNTFYEAYQKVVEKKVNNWSWVKGTICHQCIFYPKSVYKEYKYNLQYCINADYAYNLKLWNKVDFVHIDVLVSFFSSSGLSGNNRIDTLFRKDLPALIYENCGILPYLYKLLRMVGGKILKGR